MPLLKFAKKEDVPAEQADDAMEMKDGTFIVVEDEDTTELKATLETERTNRAAAEKNATKAARELKRLQDAAKNPDHAVPDELRKQIAADAVADYVEENAPKWKAGEDALVENRTLKVRGQLTEMALSDKGGVRKERFGKFETLYGNQFDHDESGKLMVKGKPGADVYKHIQSLKPDFPELFVGSQGQGGNAPGSQGVNAPTSGAPTLAELMKNPSAGLEFANKS